MIQMLVTQPLWRPIYADTGKRRCDESVMVCGRLFAIEVNNRMCVWVRAVDAKGIAVATKACGYASADKRGRPALYVG